MARDLPARLRLMLVELVPHEPERVNRSQSYPWLMALALSRVSTVKR